jgi:hypothetical protein
MLTVVSDDLYTIVLPYTDTTETRFSETITDIYLEDTYE